jgi:hypothetical protein
VCLVLNLNNGFFLDSWTTALDLLLAKEEEYVQLPIPPVTRVNTSGIVEKYTNYILEQEKWLQECKSIKL